MIRKSDNVLRKNKLFGFSFVGLFGKSVSKSRSHKKVINDDLTFDAMPDFPKSDKANQNHRESDNLFDPKTRENQNDTKNINIENDFKQFNENVNNLKKEDVNDNRNNEESNAKGNEKHFNFESHFKTPEATSVSNQTNVVVNGGVGIHFGNVFNNVNNVHYNAPMSNNKHHNYNKVEKTEAIKALMKCVDKLKPGHLQLLASHFGDKWQDIGATLSFTEGELHCIRNQKKDLQERAYQMLMLWSQKKGAEATVGQLCKCLWGSRVDSARESVCQLSLNYELFE